MITTGRIWHDHPRLTEDSDWSGQRITHRKSERKTYIKLAAIAEEKGVDGKVLLTSAEGTGPRHPSWPDAFLSHAPPTLHKVNLQYSILIEGTLTKRDVKVHNKC